MFSKALKYTFFTYQFSLDFKVISNKADSSLKEGMNHLYINKDLMSLIGKIFFIVRKIWTLI